MPNLDELKTVNRLITKFQSEIRSGTLPNRQSYLAQCPEPDRWILEALIEAAMAIQASPDKAAEIIFWLNNWMEKAS